MANIRVDVDGIITDGQSVTFKAPCDCSEIEGLKIYYIKDKVRVGELFTMKDSRVQNLSTVNNLFAAGAYVTVVLDTVNKRAFLQNAATSGYIEEKVTPVDNLESDRADLPLSARMGSELNKKLIELWEKVFPNIVWLFSPTEKYTDTTGNYFASGSMWSSYYWGSGVPTISTTTNGYMKIKTANDKSGSVFSQKTVDVTAFDKIVVQYITHRKGNLEAFGLTTSTGDRYSFAKHVELLNSNSTIATATLDVSKLSGKYYLGFSLCESGQWVEMDITSIHME